MSEAFDDSCSNNGPGARFTCPGCYTDLEYSKWVDRTGECPACGREIHCHVESEPVSVCELVEEDGND